MKMFFNDYCLFASVVDSERNLQFFILFSLLLALCAQGLERSMGTRISNNIVEWVDSGKCEMAFTLLSPLTFSLHTLKFYGQKMRTGPNDCVQLPFAATFLRKSKQINCCTTLSPSTIRNWQPSRAFTHSTYRNVKCFRSPLYFLSRDIY